MFRPARWWRVYLPALCLSETGASLQAVSNTNHRVILVTGGAGFIGSELVRQLAAEGHRVCVVDNLTNGRRANLDGVLGENVQLVVADVRDQERMAGLLRRVDLVFHLACLGVRHSIHSPHENHEVNATATLRLVSLAREVSVRRFVYVSSSEVYGHAARVPMSEEHPTFPTTVYGASKLAGECYTRAFHRTHGYETVVVRPFNAFGPRCHHEGDCGEVIPKFLLRCMAGQPLIVFGDGNQTRDFTYVGDTARGIMLAGWAESVVGETINLGSGREISMNELAERIKATVGREDVRVVHEEARPGDVLRLCADGGKARELLGFTPRIGLPEGLAILKNWYERGPTPVEELLVDERSRNWELEPVPVDA
ncbi:MAG: SDR family NAD(P)-dependent oxidoreductase [Planctomycetes bacterium]|nr:SDR family NAD(P)-dependent oxidoreductase [Planctomycetota bacterium]